MEGTQTTVKEESASQAMLTSVARRLETALTRKSKPGIDAHTTIKKIYMTGFISHTNPVSMKNGRSGRVTIAKDDKVKRTRKMKPKKETSC